MKRIILSMILGFVLLYTKAQPTTNPVLDRYPAKIIHWTNNLKWNMVVDVTTTNAVVQNNSFSNLKFPDAASIVWVIDSVNLSTVMIDISTGGGGVLYFPEGDYIFEFDIELPSNVVLRGATPSSDKLNAFFNNFSPPTHFIFPKYLYSNTGTGTSNKTAFKHIHASSSIDNAGLAWLTINRAIINFLPKQTDWSTNIAIGDEAPYSGTFTQEQPKTVSENIIIFGIRSTNAVERDNGVPKVGKQNLWQRYPNRRTGNINTFIYKNGFISNNRLNDVEGCANFGDGYPYNGDGYHPVEMGIETASAYTNITYPIQPDDFVISNYKNDAGVDVGSVKFSYNMHYGMMINRGKLAFKPIINMTDWYSTINAYTTETEPSSMGINIEVLDNWVFKTMRPALQIGGNGVEVRRNITRDWMEKEYSANNVTIGPDGLKTPAGQTTFENRGIDISGWNCIVDSNFIEAYRSKVGGYLSTDGEGILHQESSGSTINGMTITNNIAFNYIGLYKSRDIQNANLSWNTLHKSFIMVQADLTTTAASCINVSVNNNTIANGGISFLGSNGGINCFADGNKVSSTLTLSCYIKESNTTGNIVWRDASGTVGVTVLNPCIEGVFPIVTITNPSSNEYIENIPTSPVNITTQVSMNGVSNFSNWKIKLFINMTIITDSLNIDGSYTYTWNITEKNVFNISAQITNPVTGKIYYSPVRVYNVGSPNNNITAVNLPVEELNSNLIIYPNPTSGLLNIKVGDSFKGGLLEVFNVTGKTLKQIKNINNESDIDLSNFKSGIYLIVISNDKIRQTKKVIIK